MKNITQKITEKVQKNAGALKTLGLATALTILPIQETLGQHKKKTIKEKTNTELVSTFKKPDVTENNDSIKILSSMPIQKIIELYGVKKTQEICQKTGVFAMNQIRKDFGANEVKVDATLEKMSQNFAEQMARYQKVGHKINGRESTDFGIKPKQPIILENCSVDPISLSMKEIVEIRVYFGQNQGIISGHREAVVGSYLEYAGFGIKIVERKVFSTMNSGGFKMK